MGDDGRVRAKFRYQVCNVMSNRVVRFYCLVNPYQLMMTISYHEAFVSLLDENDQEPGLGFLLVVAVVDVTRES